MYQEDQEFKQSRTGKFQHIEHTSATSGQATDAYPTRGSAHSPARTASGGEGFTSQSSSNSQGVKPPPSPRQEANRGYEDQLVEDGIHADREQMSPEDHEDEDIADQEEDIEQEGTETESQGDTDHCESEQVRRDDEGDLLKRESLGELSQGDDLEIENHSEDENESLDSHDKLQNLLNEINDTCIESLKNDETENALETLKRAEQILEDFTNEGKDVDRNMIIIILYN